MVEAEVPVSRVDAAAYTVPLGETEADATLAWSAPTLVAVWVRAGEVSGLGYTYAAPACVPLVHDVLAGVLRGRDVCDVPAAWEAMRAAVRNLGRPGLVSCALSAVETALWDAAARLADLPLCRLLGRAHRQVPVYGSGGFTTFSHDRLRRQLEDWLGRGMTQVKIKIGEEWGQRPARDLRRIADTRRVIGSDVGLFVDANGGYGTSQAIRVGHRMEDFAVRWFEEPVSSDDLAGLRKVRERVEADVTAGEYGYDLPYFHRMLAAEAVDCLQVDVTRCGGFSEWLRAAALANARNGAVSGHCAGNLAAHVAAATPNIRHLEWFADHERVERLLFDGTLDSSGGSVTPDPTVPGHGLHLKEADAAPYQVA